MTYKFRAYSSKAFDRKPKMYYWEDIKDNILNWFESDAQVMQYVGREDSEGTEVYEGDIIEYENGNAGYGRPRHEEISKYIVPHLYHIDWDDWIWVGTGKVIGNIYENTRV